MSGLTFRRVALKTGYIVVSIIIRVDICVKWMWWHHVVYREDCARLAAEANTLRRACDATRETDTLTGSEQQQQQSDDWVQVRMSSAGHVDVAAVSTTEKELKRRVDKLSSMISEVRLFTRLTPVSLTAHL